MTTVDYTERWFNRAMEFREALQDLAQYAATIENGQRSAGDVLPLQRAFKLLGWKDPMLVPPEELCGVPGCGRQWVIHSTALNIKRCGLHWKPT
jgi:hypothetical protein